MADAITKMAEMNRGYVLATDSDGRLSGIFTEKDLATRVVLAAEEWRNESVARYMTTKIKTVRLDTPITSGLLMMTAGRFRHLPILDRAGAPYAVVSIRDIIAHIADCFPKEFINLPPDPQRATRQQWGG